MKFEFHLDEGALRTLAEHVRNAVYQAARSGHKGLLATDVPSEMYVRQHSSWATLIRDRVESAIEELKTDIIYPIPTSAVTVEFADLIEMARSNHRSRGGVKNKTIKLEARNLTAAKKLLKEHGIEFE